MLKYIAKRLLRSLVTLAIVITIIFSLLRLMPIEGYFPNYDKLSPGQIQASLTSMGLLDPLPVQLWNFISGVFQGDLGTSLVYRVNVPITQIIAEKAPISIELGLLSVGLSLLVGIPLGVGMALASLARQKKGVPALVKRTPLRRCMDAVGMFFATIWEKIGTIFIVVIQAVPSAVYYLFIQLYGTDLFGLPTLFNKNNYATWILPVVSLALGNIAYYAMWLRRYMTDEINKDYVQLAKAKGVSSSGIMFRHVFRNAFVPMIQYLPGSILFTVMGSIYVESLYSIPGMGGLLVNVIQRQDNTMVQALVLIYSVISIVALILGDILMSIADPRIKLGKKEEAR